MATTTVPDVSATTPNIFYITLYLIDASGDLATALIKTTQQPTLAEIEAWKIAYQAATQASIYRVELSEAWEGDADPQNADALQRSSVKDGVNELYRDVILQQSNTLRLIAPIPAVMQGNQDIPLWSVSQATNLVSAELALLKQAWSLQSVQFTERRERSNNPRVKI